MMEIMVGIVIFVWMGSVLVLAARLGATRERIERLESRQGEFEDRTTVALRDLCALVDKNHAESRAQHRVVAGTIGPMLAKLNGDVPRQKVYR